VFLQELVEKDLSYNAINTVRSALSDIMTIKAGERIGQHPDISRFIW